MQENEEVKQAIDQVLHIHQRVKAQEDGEWGKETQEPTRIVQSTGKHVFSSKWGVSLQYSAKTDCTGTQTWKRRTLFTGKLP